MSLPMPVSQWHEMQERAGRFAVAMDILGIIETRSNPEVAVMEYVVNLLYDLVVRSTAIVEYITDNPIGGDADGKLIRYCNLTVNRIDMAFQLLGVEDE